MDRLSETCIFHTFNVLLKSLARDAHEMFQKNPISVKEEYLTMLDTVLASWQFWEYS